MYDDNKLQYGLQPTQYDPRDFSLGGVFGTVRPGDIPLQDFLVADPLEIKDQEGILDDGCTGFSLTSVSEDQEGVILDPGFTFAMIKRQQGTYKTWGGDLRSGCKVATEIGFIEVGQNPDDFSGKSRDYIANWNNWKLDQLIPLAQQHRKQSYFKADGPFDTFDNFRSHLWANRFEKSSIYTGATWRPGWLYAKDGIIPRHPIAGGVGHAFKLLGQVVINGEPFLVAQNSYGKDAGKDGLHFFAREVVNREFNFGGYMFKDMLREDAEKILRGKGLLPNNSSSSLWDWVKGLLSSEKLATS